MSAQLLAANAVQNVKEARGERVQQQPPAGNAEVIHNALTALLAYIPTEATVIYLATISALPAIQEALPVQSVYVYWSFVIVISPLLFVLFFFNQLACDDKEIPSFTEFPWFRLLACAVAFAAWALCVPNNPPDKPGLGVLYGLIAVVVSILLPVIERIHDWVIRNNNIFRVPGPEGKWYESHGPYYDPWKGFADGHMAANGFELSCENITGKKLPVRVPLRVRTTRPIADADWSVTFLLHHTFKEPVRRVFPEEQLAQETLFRCWGAFTVGAVVQEKVAQNGQTTWREAARLELDLANERGAPPEFYQA